MNISKDPQVYSRLSPLRQAYLCTLCFSTIPDWLSWLQYLSWFNYGYEALVVNQWENYGNISKPFTWIIIFFKQVKLLQWVSHEHITEQSS